MSQAQVDKKIRSQLVSTLESGEAHLAFAEATKASDTGRSRSL